MNLKRLYNMQRLITILGFFALCITNSAFAELRTFEKGYVYQASDIDSKLTCRTIAMEQVKRLLLEELGVYLESKTEVKNFRLTKDEITTLTAGIVRSEIIDEQWDGKAYYLKVMIMADPDEVARSIDFLRRDQQKTKELKEARRIAAELSREIVVLRKDLEKIKEEHKQPELLEDGNKIRQYNETVEKLRATDWFEEGYSLSCKIRKRSNT